MRDKSNTDKDAANQALQQQTSTRARSPIRLTRAASPAFMGTLLVAVLLAALVLWRVESLHTASGSGMRNAQGSCAPTGQSGNSDPTADWITLDSTSPSDIVAAMREADIFSGLESRFGGDFVFDQPMLVHPYHPANPNAGSDFYVDDHWVVSVRNDSGREVGIFDYVYDCAGHRIRLSSFGVLTPRDPGYGHAFPAVSAEEAMNAVQTQRGVAPASGATPQLIFFPLAENRQGPEAPNPWTGGGTAPPDPMWLIARADGRNYFVNMKLHTYTQADLPIASA